MAYRGPGGVDQGPRLSGIQAVILPKRLKGNEYDFSLPHPPSFVYITEWIWTANKSTRKFDRGGSIANLVLDVGIARSVASR